MRHRIKARKLNRSPSHHKAMQRNLAQSLIQHGQVRTTLQKARDLRPFVERLVTLARSARSGSITARRRIHKLLGDRSFVPTDRQSEYDDLSKAKRAKTLRTRSGRRYRVSQPKGKLKFTGASIAHRLVNLIAGQFEGRPGGYTRLVKLAKRRIGDGGQLALLQFIGEEQSPGSLMKPAESARKRRADSRYALAVKLAKQRRGDSTRVDSPVSDQETPTSPPAGAEGGLAEGNAEGPDDR